MRNFKNIVTGIFTLIILLSWQNIDGADATRILWFGHSLLKSGGIARDKEFAVWAQQTGKPLYQQMQNSGDNYNYEIIQSWNETFNKDTIAKGEWDYVIYNTLYKPYIPIDSFYICHALYASLVDSVSALSILYDDWHQPSTPFALKVCEDNGNSISPVNTAYFWLLERYPNIHYKVDWAHAAEPLGYLAGCITWASVFCEKPYGLDTVYAKLDREMAHLMQQAAWNTVVDSRFLVHQPWPFPPTLVKSIQFTSPEDTLEQYRSGQLAIRTVFENDSVEASSNWAIFRSLDPNIVTVTHSGIATGVNLGTGRVEAIRENKADTLYLTIKATTLTLDSVKISPDSFTSYLESGFQFRATGYFRDGNLLSTRNVTTSINWISSDTTIFTLANGYLQRTSGRSGYMFAAIEMSGKTDTVRFTMAPELQYVIRLNFQLDSTVYNSIWTPEWGQAYSDSLGYGWEDIPYHAGVPYFKRRIDANAIDFEAANFLTHSYINPWHPQDNITTTGTLHLKALDGDYIVKVGLGHGDWNSMGEQISTVVFEGDTIARDSAYAKKPAQTYIDTIRVFGMGGIKLQVNGAINYIVVCSKEGVDIDSIALDNGEYAVKVPNAVVENRVSANPEISRITASPNPFNPVTRIHITQPLSGIYRGGGELKIFNSQGRMVNADCKKMADNSYLWNAAGMASGVYIARYEQGFSVLKRRITLMK